MMPSLSSRSRMVLAVWILAGGMSWLIPHANGQSESPTTVSVMASKNAVLYYEDSVADPPVDRAIGQSEFITLGFLDFAVPRRALLAFSLDRIVPPGVKIVTATLKLTIPPNFGAFPVTAVYPLQEAWGPGSEATPEFPELGAPALDGDATWRYRVYREDENQRLSWRTPGGSFNPQAPLYLAQASAEDRVVSITSEALVNDVQRLLDSPDSHFGWILTGDEQGITPSVRYYGSGAVDEANRPVLEIGYVKGDDYDKLLNSYNALKTVAGAGTETENRNHWKTKMEGGPALTAELSGPLTARADASGNLYIADTYAHAVRQVRPDGTIHTVVGTNTAGFNGDGPGTEAQLDSPSGLYLLSDGSVIILDTGNARIRSWNPASGELRTVCVDPNGIQTGRGLWASPDGSEIVYANRTKLMQWLLANGADSAPQVLAAGFTNVGFLDKDPRTERFLVADFERDRVWSVAADGSSKDIIAGGGLRTTSGGTALETRLTEVHGIAATPSGYFITTLDGGDLWYVDANDICHIVIQGSQNSNIRRGEGEMLAAIAESAETKISDPRSVTLAPNGDLVLTVNPSGLIRVVEKGLSPLLNGFGITEDGGFRLNWRSETGKTYIIEGSEDLRTWQSIGERVANRESSGFVDPSVDERHRFHYRVRIFP